jgi:hypothetical protein
LEKLSGDRLPRDESPAYSADEKTFIEKKRCLPEFSPVSYGVSSQDQEAPAKHRLAARVILSVAEYLIFTDN